MYKAKKIECASLFISPKTTLFYTGPSLGKGPLPAIFYFALSGEDSLILDPYNQFVQFLSDFPVRIFSLTLPYHEKPLSPVDALKSWAEDMKNGRDIFQTFLDSIQEGLRYVIDQNIALPDKIAAAGLSRGGFIASHAAAQNPEFRYIVQFAPITDLSISKEFHAIKEHPLVMKYNVEHLAPALADKHMRFYIGNHDQRVGTRNTFEFLEALVKAAVQKKIRTPQIELIVTPSIGQQGHGTSPESFKGGALYLADLLLQGLP